MKVAIMQPYVFPYIGYFQLINAADVFVIYDDVNFRKQSWLNRNKILLNGNEFLFTFPCKGISSFKKINEIQIDYGKKPFEKFKKLIEQAYRKAPHFTKAMKFIEKIMDEKPQNISELGKLSVLELCNYLEIKTTILISSEKFSDSVELIKEYRLKNICKKIGAVDYINAQGGQQLYSKKDFSKENINLNFLIPNDDIRYSQINSEDFIPWLSIIDLIMHNSLDECKLILNAYSLK